MKYKYLVYLIREKVHSFWRNDWMMLREMNRFKHKEWMINFFKRVPRMIFDLHHLCLKLNTLSTLFGIQTWWLTTQLHHISFIHSNGHDYNKLIDLQIKTSEESFSMYSSFCQKQHKLFHNTCSLCIPLYMNKEDIVDYKQVHWLLSLLPFIAMKHFQSHVIIWWMHIILVEKLLELTLYISGEIFSMNFFFFIFERHFADL